MPSKNSINRPKNRNTARAKAQHKSAVSRRTQQTDIVYGKVDSKKVAQKKLRKARLAEAHAKAIQQDEPREDVQMDDVDEQAADNQALTKLDTKAKKEARKAKILSESQQPTTTEGREFKMDTTTGRGTTLGGPPTTT